MKFGKELRRYLQQSLPEWRDKYLCYKLLKKLLKNDAEESIFVQILNKELEKFNNFYVNKEEELMIRLEILKKRKGSLKKDSYKEIDIQKDFVVIHGQMILLKNYSSLNFTGLNKILKKHDKRTGGFLRQPFTRLVFQQPFLVTEPLTRLVLECEANLDIHFSLKKEVVNSVSTAKEADDQPGLKTANDVSYEALHFLGGETVDLRRNIEAAIRVMETLKKSGSTPNTLSFSSFLENGKEEDEDVTSNPK